MQRDPRPLVPSQSGVRRCSASLPLTLQPAAAQPSAAAVRAQPALPHSAPRAVPAGASHSDSSVTDPPSPLSPPTAVAPPVHYHAACMHLSAARRGLAHMKPAFERHNDMEGGLSSAALVAALKEVHAPVLSTSEGASGDSLFRRRPNSSDGRANARAECGAARLAGASRSCKRFFTGASCQRQFACVRWGRHAAPRPHVSAAGV